jgi:hypothetical protein
MRGYDEKTIYIVYVLWTAGFSQNAVAFICGLRKGRVARIIQKSEYADRTGMGEAARRLAFDELMAVRRVAGQQPLDGGFFDRIRIEFKPLNGRQSRRIGLNLRGRACIQ